MTRRPPYEIMPSRLRGWVERELGSQVVTAVTQDSGFSPGVAARLVTTSGRRAFVKAIATSKHVATAELHRYEIEAMNSIPPSRMLPRLYGTYDDGDWVGLLLEDIDGRHPDPWTSQNADKVGKALDELVETFTPSPWPAAQRLAAAVRVNTNWWTQVDRRELPAWMRAHIDELIALQDHVVPSVEGRTLCLRDMRVDNILITASGQVRFVDWAWASNGAPWVDTLQLACDIVGAGGSTAHAEQLVSTSPHCQNLDQECLTAYLANLAGSAFVKSRSNGGQPIARLQAWRRARADALITWLYERTGWST